MIFTELSIENYRCFEEETVTFEQGVNVIYGLNGTGKSTLLEACFFALYGSDALRETDSNLDDVITNGAQTTTVELRFVQDNNKYRVVREVRERSGRVTQAVCELETPDETVSGATEVDSEIRRMIRMDASSFLNCAYIRQGEIEKLIQAKPSERQALIDNLLQLGKLEEYKTRASDIRVGVGRVRDKKRSLKEDRKETIQKREDRNLSEKLDGLNESIENINQKIRDYENGIESLEEKKSACEDIVDEQEGLYEELQKVNSKIETHESKIKSINGDIEELKTTIEDKQEVVVGKEQELEAIVDSDEVNSPIDVSKSLSDIKSEKENLSEVPLTIENTILEKKNEMENAVAEKERLEKEIRQEKKNVTENENQIEEIASKLSNELLPEKERLESDIEDCVSTIETIGRKLRKAEETEKSLKEKKQQLEEQRVGVVEQRVSVSGDKKAAGKELERAEELKEKGKCPECGQDVCDSPEVNKISDIKQLVDEFEEQYESLGDEIKEIDGELEEVERLQEVIGKLSEVSRERKNKRELLDKQLEAIKSAEKTEKQCETEIESSKDVINQNKEKIVERSEMVSECKEKISKLKERKQRAEGRLSVLREAIRTKERIQQLRSEIEAAETTVGHKSELKDEKSQHLDELTTEKNRLDVKVDVDELERAEKEIEELIDEIEEVSVKIEDIEKELSEKQQRKGKLQNEIEQLNNLCDERDRFESEVQELEEVYSQMETIEEMYVQLRGDLRQENVHQLEKSLNELFDIAYQNDSYDRIELDGEYSASVIEKTSGELDPKKLSGGEKALFNLSLRCAIYQLLVEGLGGKALMPPLILDEPTVHLDEGHIGKIDDIVRRMRDIGVEQSIVVSHDEEVIDSSNHRIRVEQQGSDNRSMATVESELFI